MKERRNVGRQTGGARRGSKKGRLIRSVLSSEPGGKRTLGSNSCADTSFNVTKSLHAYITFESKLEST